MARDPATSETFRRFGRVECAGYCPFYEDLALRVAEDASLLALVEERLPGQPAPNLLFGAVRFLLAGGLRHPVAEDYARVDREGGGSGAVGAWPRFRGFCLENADAIRRVVSTRRVQTNEVGRSAILRVGVAAATAGMEGPVAWVDVGASAGLNLHLDRYRVRYRHPDGTTLDRGPAAAEVVLDCEVRGDRVPPTGLAAPCRRIGLDLEPVDVRDEEAVRWLEALVWPGQPERARRLRSAVEVARSEPPDLRRGDAADLLPSVLEGLPAGAAACVFHSAVWQQVPPASRERIEQALAEAARARPVARVGLTSSSGPFDLTAARAGDRSAALVARAHAHGGWIEWRGFP